MMFHTFILLVSLSAPARHTATVRVPDLWLANLQQRIASQVIAGKRSPAHLAISDQASRMHHTEDQALFVLAMLRGGERSLAETVLNAMANLQRTDGAWAEHYNPKGEVYGPQDDRKRATANSLSQTLGYLALASAPCRQWLGATSLNKTQTRFRQPPSDVHRTFALSNRDSLVVPVLSR